MAADAIHGENGECEQHPSPQIRNREDALQTLEHQADWLLAVEGSTSIWPPASVISWLAFVLNRCAFTVNCFGISPRASLAPLVTTQVRSGISVPS